jgi:3-oxoacyl-[acyl-carrier protein] reductase
MDLLLNDKVCAITGPAKGMGAEITNAFAAEGCKLALLARDIGAVEPLAASLKQKGTTVAVHRCDVTDAAQCEAAIKLVLEQFGRVDILVNVAGGTGTIGKSGVEITPDEFDDIVTLNLNGCFHTMRAVLPAMIEQRYGKIVNVGGTFGLRGRAGRVGYSSAKWGLRGLTKSFALEVGPHNINVNCVAPGIVDGPRFREKVCVEMANRLGISVEEAAKRHAADYALKRISTDTDVANTCLFLASEVSRQLTGVDIPVDGGWAAL